jgi:hypothetical protein
MVKAEMSSMFGVKEVTARKAISGRVGSASYSTSVK